MDPGATVTYNGVQIGHVDAVKELEAGGKPEAELALTVDSRYLELIPDDVDATINATTMFGAKHVSMTAPNSRQRNYVRLLCDRHTTSVTVEFDTLFETVLNLTQRVDPIKLNQTLTATAQALDGLGGRSARHSRTAIGFWPTSIHGCPRSTATTDCWVTSPMCTRTRHRSVQRPAGRHDDR